MTPKAALLPLLLGLGLLLAGCTGAANSPEPSVSTTTTPPETPSPEPTPTDLPASPSPTDDPASPHPTDDPAPVEPAPAEPAPAEPAPAEPGPADLLAIFSATPEGAQYAGAVTAVEKLAGQDGNAVHRLTTSLYDPGVAVGLCQTYRSVMQTGQEQVDVLDPLGQLLATTVGHRQACGTAPAAPPPPGALPQQDFTYEEALAAWHNGMPYYDAFCIHYTPVTEAGLSQCRGIDAGTVDAVTGEYVGG